MADRWAVIVSTSQYFHNYRHVSNALSIYRAARRLGLPDSRIVLMLADDVPSDARNAAAGSMYNSGARQLDLLAPGVRVDYHGAEVGVESFLGVLTGVHPPGTPASRRMSSGEESHVMVYLTGHGGENFLKFRDHTELTSRELADAIVQMRLRRRYGSLLLLTDTCQARDHVRSPAARSLGEMCTSSHTGDDPRRRD